MSRYIDADKLIEIWKPDHDRQFVADYFIHTIENAPTADVKPIVYYIEKLEKIKIEIKKLRYGSDTYKNAIDDVVEIINSEITTMRKEEEE